MDSFFLSFKFFLLLLVVQSCYWFDIDNQSLKTYNNSINDHNQREGWLLMIYMSGTGTLEEESITDLFSIESGYVAMESKTDVDIVVLYDRGPGFSVSNGDLTGTYLYELTDDGLNTVDYVDGWRKQFDQEESMGDIGTLDSFISWARDNYKREKSGLILWNHGGGVSGERLGASRAVCWDTEDYNNDVSETLYVDEIQQLLSLYYYEGNKLDLLGFDACYMGMFEILYEFREAVEYIVASPAPEYGGWRYEDFISILNKSISSDELAKNIVESYYHFSISSNYMNTLAVYNISKVEEAVQRFNTLLELLIEIDKEELIEIRGEVLKYYSLENTNDELLYPYVDLISYVSQFTNDADLNDADLNDAVSDLILSVEDIVEESFNLVESDHSESIGNIALFFPSSSENYDYCWWYTDDDTHGYGGIDFCLDCKWKEFLDRIF